jgi:hypothetical protein
MADKIKVTFNKNVNLNGDRFKQGDSFSVSKEEHEELLKLKVIDGEAIADEPVDYFSLSAEELKKVHNDKLKAFLFEENIDVPANAKKDDLIKLITGEDE